VVYKKQNLKFYSKVMVQDVFSLNKDIKSNLKKQSSYFSSYEFKVILMNAILRLRSYCVVRYSIFIERILNVLWETHCIFGYSLIYKKNKYFIKIYLKQDIFGFSVINSIYAYKKNTTVTWQELQKLILRESGIIYIISTNYGILEGKSALKLGIGGSLIYKLIL